MENELNDKEQLDAVSSDPDSVGGTNSTRVNEANQQQPEEAKSAQAAEIEFGTRNWLLQTAETQPIPSGRFGKSARPTSRRI